MLRTLIVFTLVLTTSLTFAQDKGAEKKQASDKKQADKKEAVDKSTSPSDKADEAKEKGGDKAKKEAAAKPREVHILPLSGNYVDHPQPMSLDPTALLLGGAAKQKSFFRLCDYLKKLEQDEDISGILFDLSNNVSFNSAQLDELTRRMQSLQKSGKTLVAWLEDASGAQLAVAAACDKALMSDFGGADMPSVSMESMFFRDAMDLLGVQASIVRAGDFKGAVEPYTNPKMSDHLRAHQLNMLKSMNDAVVDRIVDGRQVTKDEVRTCQKARILSPKETREAGLIDRVVPVGKMRDAAAKYFGRDVKWITMDGKAKKSMSFFELMGRMMAEDARGGRISGDTVVVLQLSGTIVTGKEESSGSIVSKPTVATIEQLMEDENVKGVIVRINSPGGSATASEVIRQKLAELADAKPTIVSMGNMAASGGYWISCIDAPVYAERGTLTGSIGVFSMKMSAGALLRRVGVHIESLTIDDSAGMMALDRGWDGEQQQRLQKMVDDIYNRFLTLVAEHRELPKEQVAGIAGGRVWSGSQAKELGLVDEFGGVDTCIAALKKKLKLEKVKVIYRPKPRTGLDLSDLLSDGSDDEITTKMLHGSSAKLLKARGFSLGTTMSLIRDSLEPKHPRANVWLLHPAEMVIR